MTESNSAGGFENEVYFARLAVALELRQTHGMIFAACFLEQFDAEIRRAVLKKSALLRDAMTVGGN